MFGRALLVSSALLAATAPAEAGLQVVRGEGRAVVSGKDASPARKQALAEALYDAAGKLGTRIRGASLLNQGVLREEMNALVDGRFKTWAIVREGREGSAFVVTIEAVGETDGETCGGKRIDLDLRAVTIRVAPGVQGHVHRIVQEGFSRGFAMLGEGEAFRVADQRHLPQIRSGERTNASQYDYLAQVTDSRPSPAGYSVSGDIVVERARRDNLIVNMTDVVVTIGLKLRDNYTGAQIGTIRRSMNFSEKRNIFGLDPAFDQGSGRVDIGALFERVRQDLEDMLACQPLRAAVLQTERGRLLLSVGLEHGVRPGDYFLVGAANAKGDWQIVKIEDATPTQSVARTLKPSPVIPANALATLMR